MNKQQVKWAASHDWYVRSRRTPYGTFIIEVRCEQVDASGVWSLDEQTFTDFQSLRAWAGY